MAQCSGKHISAMQLFYELKQRFPHIPDRLINHCIEQAQGNKEACWCLLESEKARMSEIPIHRLEVEVSPALPSPTRQRPQRPPVVRTTYMPLTPNIWPARRDQSFHNLIRRQNERKSNLERELKIEKKRLKEMQIREQELKTELRACLAVCNVSLKAKAVSEEISLLRFECTKLWNELESQNEEAVDAVDELCWCCHVCTFHNHQLLSQCEFCSMPRISLGTPLL